MPVVELVDELISHFLSSLRLGWLSVFPLDDSKFLSYRKSENESWENVEVNLNQENLFKEIKEDEDSRMNAS